MHTPEERIAKIARIERFPDELEAAVAGLDDAALDFRPEGREWSVRQNVHHLVDSHAHAFIRMKLALTEDNPTIRPYDQDVFAEMADSLHGPVSLSLLIMHGLHGRWALLMRSLSEADWARTFQHPENGGSTVARILEGYSKHCDAHLDQIARALADYEAS